MNLNPRERRLLMILGGVIVLILAYVLFLRGGGDEVAIPELFPTPSVESPTVAPSPTASPSFVIPAGARDPFKP